MNRYFAKLTNKQVLDEYNAGRPVWSIEMGGMGPGYEQVIQLAIFKIFNHLHKNKVKEKDMVKNKKYTDNYDKMCMELVDGWDMSGAQFGVAKHVAAQYHLYGYGYMMKTTPEDRLIQTSNCKNLKKAI